MGATVTVDAAEVRYPNDSDTRLTLSAITGGQLPNDPTKIEISPGGLLVRIEREGEPSQEKYAINWAELYNLQGRLLTLVDATFTDREQRKAFKDRVKQDLQAWSADVERSARADAEGSNLPPLKDAYYERGVAG